MPQLPPLILASASPRRAQLLRELGLDFKIVTAQAAEVTPHYLTPSEMAMMNARKKALAVAVQYPRALVLGADTLVCLGHEVFGKPESLADAQRMLARLQGRTHQVITGVCLIQLCVGREKLVSVSTDVQFKSLTSAQIQQYLATIHPLDKAGAYAIQEQGDMIVEHYTGSYTNVVGLPMERIKEELAQWKMEW